ncbi:MAG: hypothetical protein E7033_04520 [Akkermansiaceae bacterium]|nr:hypothetical protein [Akkermansiaceae bacterium]
MKRTTELHPTKESYHRALRHELNDIERRVLDLMCARGCNSTVSYDIEQETHADRAKIKQALQKLQQAQLIIQEGEDNSPGHYRLTVEGRRISLLH